MPSSSSLQLEHPAVTELHKHLVQSGDFDKVEEFLASIAYPQLEQGLPASSASSLFDHYCETALPAVQWTRLDSQPGISTWDGDAPSARGGHQLVLVEGKAYIKGDASSLDKDTVPGSYLYLYGGWNGVTELGDLWRFDLQQQRWELLSSDSSQDLAIGADGAQIFGPDARSCHQMVVDQETGEIYMLGRFVDAQAVRRSAALPMTQADSGMHVEGVSTGIQEPGYRGDGADSTARDAGASRMGSLAGEHFNEPCDFWRLHTRGPHSGTWELLSENVEVRSI